MKNLDHLFDLPHSISIPEAYWLDHDFVTTVLMVFEPSMTYYARVEGHFRHAVANYWFDMDIVNHEFRRELHILPPEYAMLNSEFEGAKETTYFGTPTDAYHHAYYIHFTAIGKPWMHSVSEIRKRVQKHEVHPLMLDLWKLWHSYSHVCLPYSR